MSKSLGNVVDPIELCDTYSAETVRFYILSGINSFDNTNWSNTELVGHWNDLVGYYGNLIARVLHLVDIIGTYDTAAYPEEWAILEEEAKSLFVGYEFRHGYAKAQALCACLNKRISDGKPWETKDKGEIGLLLRALVRINELYRPALPVKCSEIDRAIQSRKKAVLFQKIKKMNFFTKINVYSEWEL
jgi:methionyl-tRNA synthetase